MDRVPKSPSFFQKKDISSFFGNESSFFSKPVIQTKLDSNNTGDKSELEAEDNASKVAQGLPMTERTTAPNLYSNLNTSSGPNLQTKCSTCEQEEKLQTKEENDSSAVFGGGLQLKPIFENNGQLPGDDEQSAGVSMIESELKTAKGGGVPLPAAAREQMEGSFGANFSDVKLHTDTTAAQMNKTLQSQAFTNGKDIYFNSGKFNSTNKEGKHLLAHELTHVVQQASLTHSPAPVQRQVADAIPETRNQFYGHGAFMGAAPQLMANPKWNRILQVLMPDVHKNASNLLSKGPQSEDLILMFENNPVMAAYGMYITRALDKTGVNRRTDRIEKLQAIEWDVFLPTNIVGAFKRAQTDPEKNQLAQQMVTEMIIAHGTTWQTISENRRGKRQYEEVKKTPKSGQGGVRPGAWMDLFGKALQLATDPNWEQKAKEFEDPTLHPRINSPADQAAHLTFRNQLSFREVIDLYKQLFGKKTFSVLLDIKSRDATPEVLRALVSALNTRGVLVYGVGTFEHGEIVDLSSMTQLVDRRVYAGPKEVKFFHFAGDLQNDCLANKITEGDTVMFNAGSLITYSPYPWVVGKALKKSYKIKSDVVNQLRVYKHHYGFHLGVYVQENDIDDRAATLITELTNNESSIFDLGFAWGGLSGQTASDIEPVLKTKTWYL